VIHAKKLLSLVLASKLNNIRMTQKDSRSAFSAFRIKKGTVKYLQDMKRAFEIYYGKELSNDDFIEQLAQSVENGNPAAWDIFCRMQSTQKELEKIAAESRKQLEQ